MDSSLISTAGYASAALANILLLALLLASWRGRLQGGLLVIAVLLTVISNAGNALQVYSGTIGIGLIFVLECLKQAAWSMFLVRLMTLRADAFSNAVKPLIHFALPATGIFYALLSGIILFSSSTEFPTTRTPSLAPLLMGAILIIWLIEQLFRNSSASERWANKYLCMGVGGAIAFDTILFIDALLFNQINPATWAARGFVQAIAVPLIAVSATRNPAWEVKVFVSRSVVFFSGSLIAVGGYLLLVALAGYFLKTFGGNWGEILQITFVFAALLGLLVIASSVQLRGQVKQFIARHFYRNKYEYRDEWLALTERLSDPDISTPHLVALSAIRDLLASPGGALWSPDSNGKWRQSCRWEWPYNGESIQLPEHAFEKLQNQAAIIDLTQSAGRSDSSFLPPALIQGNRPWLLIPLNSHGKLQALIQVSESHEQSRQLDWEDIALVTAASHQVAAYIAFHGATDALAQARQFEAYNRLSAFLVHDLKNVVAQLQLVVQNSQKHADNPEFITDTYSTVRNAVNKMTTMLDQLRHRHTLAESDGVSAIDIGALLSELVKQRSVHLPKPRLLIPDQSSILVSCNQERMLNVLLHLVQNAQEATAGDGRVTVTATTDDTHCRLEIEDSGCGMSDEFINNNLFKPFKTTKGNAGMGIGVYESKDYIESLGGRIDVSSELGVGSRFVITVPLCLSSGVFEKRTLNG